MEKMSICKIVKDILSRGGILESGSNVYISPGWKTIPDSERGTIPNEGGSYPNKNTKELIKQHGKGYDMGYYLGELDPILIRAKAHFNKINAIRLYSIPWDASYPSFNIRIDKTDAVKEILKKHAKYFIIGDVLSIGGKTKEDEITFKSERIVFDDWPELINRPIEKILEKYNITVPEKFRDDPNNKFFEGREISWNFSLRRNSPRKKYIQKIMLDYLNLGLEPKIHIDMNEYIRDIVERNLPHHIGNTIRLLKLEKFGDFSERDKIVIERFKKYHQK